MFETCYVSGSALLAYLMYLGHIYVYNLNKETQPINKYPKLRGEEGEKEGARLLFFFILNPRYLVFVLEMSMQKGDLQEKSQVDAGESLVLPTTYYLVLTYFRYIKELQVGRYLGANAYLLHGTFVLFC